MTDPFSHCERLVREADKDRFLATLFAPAALRPPLFALYAFNIETRRVPEAVSGPMPGEIRLQWWREMLAGERDSEAASHPVAAALLETKRHYALPADVFEDLLEARTLEVYDDPVATMHDLEDYAARAGATLLVLAARILNEGRDPQTGPLIRHAGIAEALIGLLRAFPRHAARGKTYLPADLLERHGVSRNDIFAGRASAGLRDALAEVRTLARQHLERARQEIAAAPPAVVPAVLPLALAPAWLGRLDRSEPFAPAEIPQWRRQWVLWRAARRGLEVAFPGRHPT